MDERDFYTESEVMRPATLNCPQCHRENTYELRWVQRNKKQSLPPNASAEDKRRFAVARSYAVRKDDVVNCKTCRKRFEVTGVQSVGFIVTGLPKDEEEVEQEAPKKVEPPTIRRPRGF